MNTKSIKGFNLNYTGRRLAMFVFRQLNPRWLIFMIDMSISFFSIMLAITLRFNFNILKSEYIEWGPTILLVLGVRFLSFFISRVYSGIVRYTGTKDIFRIFLVNAVGSIFIALLGFGNMLLFNGTYLVPMSIIIIDFIATVCFMMLFRFTVKLIYMEFSHIGNKKINVVIFGSKELAILARRVLESDMHSHYKVVAFISTSTLTLGKQLEGVNVYSVEDLSKVIVRHNADQLIFASKTIHSELKTEVVQICLNHHVKVFTIPNIQSWINGDLNVKNIKKLNIDDLLSRDPIILDISAIRGQLKDMTVLVTGAAGSIGSEIVRQVAKYSAKQIILVDQAETPMYNLELEFLESYKNSKCQIIVGDITSKERMEKIFLDYKPDVVYHAAAYKHVPMMENNPLEAFYNNVVGSQIVADLSHKYGVKKFIFISTDKAVNPTNVMGASKRIAEIYIQALNSQSETSYITTRFGNVLGSNGSVIPLFKRQIEAGGPITITHPEITRFFMTIPEACQLVLEASAIGKGGEIYIFDMGNSVKIVDLAKNMIRLSGLEPDIDIQIKFVGLRPGEKLYEELLHQSEDNIPTHHPKIMIAMVREKDYNIISKQIEAMNKSYKEQNELELVRQMKNIVPEFISRNSAFETLDEKYNVSRKSHTPTTKIVDQEMQEINNPGNKKSVVGR